eukprot:7595052-Prorocentrum_lima.AAC.1
MGLTHPGMSPGWSDLAHDPGNNVQLMLEIHSCCMSFGCTWGCTPNPVPKDTFLWWSWQSLTEHLLGFRYGVLCCGLTGLTHV